MGKILEKVLLRSETSRAQRVWKCGKEDCPLDNVEL